MQGVSEPTEIMRGSELSSRRYYKDFSATDKEKRTEETSTGPLAIRALNGFPLVHAEGGPLGEEREFKPQNLNSFFILMECFRIFHDWFSVYTFPC